jgi:ubiquinone/menaquinone biosynthesis C-methylase UbiE
MSGWQSSETAAEWRRNTEARNRYLAEVTAAMFDLARLAPGMRVLDLGTGAGDVALLAAARLGPGGAVVATDSSEAMVAAAEQAVRDAAAHNVTVLCMDAQTIDLPEATFDAVLARMVLMFVDDRARALGQIARVLVPGGRFAATTWSSPANNPFHAALLDVAAAAAQASPPTEQAEPAEIVRAFALADPSELRRIVEQGGFRDVEVRVVRGERKVDSVPAEIERHKTWPPVTPLFAALDEPARARAWAEVERRWRAFEGADGCVFPTEMLVVGATRP